jgi:lysine-ketoglutarate reductase/saccharopine dehydrogenase-like protein (TIGR00300 family)
MSEPAVTQLHSEEVEVAGHIIDSLLLPKILDQIILLGGDFELRDVAIGHRRKDPSHARLLITADTEERLEHILKSIALHGAAPVHGEDCRLVAADMDGAFPEGFYCSTNQDTEIRVNGAWIPVGRQEMDCGIAVSSDLRSARCVPMSDVAQGELIVIGRKGTRIRPQQRSPEAGRHDAFAFMSSTVSTEKPKGVAVRDIARAMQGAREGAGRILIVAGPAVVHTGSRDYFSRLIREGYVQVLFAGNALATHDIEQSLFGTSLGVSMEHGRQADEGHEHHLRAINRIRRCGGIQPAIEQGVLTSGIMYECVQRKIPYVLAGSIRDDGPLPDVITDALDAQRAMRELCQDVTFCLMIATTLHSIATGNLLPARVKVVCVDINPSTVTKLADRGTFQTVGLVTDVEPFLRVLIDELECINARQLR